MENINNSTGVSISSLYSQTYLILPENSGFLLPGMEAMILRPDGTHCLPNEPGELYVKGANVALGVDTGTRNASYGI